MSNTITANNAVSITTNGITDQWQSSIASLTMAGNYVSSGVMTIPTTDTQLPLGSIGTPGMVMLKNLSAANFILVGSDGTNWPFRVSAGSIAMIECAGAAIHVKADTAACKLQFKIAEA